MGPSLTTGSCPSALPPSTLRDVNHREELPNDRPAVDDSPTLDHPAGGVVESSAGVVTEPGWPALRLGNLPTVEPFPVNVFPDSVVRFIVGASNAIGCPPDFVGLPTLVVGGNATGRSASLLLKPGYLASASLYAMNVGGPSSGKSPALEAAVRPLWKIDADLQRDYLQRKQEFDLEMEAYENAKKGDKPTLPMRPALESAVVEDTTTEALARLLSLNPRGLLVWRDEGSAWVDSIGQYKNGRGTDRQFWLSGLFGKTIRVDRKGNADMVPFRVPHPFLSVIGNLPPDMLGSLREAQGRSDGFLERILFAFPDPRPKTHWSEAGFPAEAIEEWARIVQKLRAFPMAIDQNGESTPNVVHFLPDAKNAWVAAYNAHVDDLNSPTSNAGGLASEGKLADFAGRLVLILHMLQLAASPTRMVPGSIPHVPRTTVEGAVRLWDYFRSHHRRVRASMAGKGLFGMPDGARLILNWIKNHPDKDQFSEGHLSQTYSPSRGYDRAMFEDGLRWLADRHAIRRMLEHSRPQGKKGRTPAPTWEVHPELRSRLDNQGNQGEHRPGGRGEDSPDFPDSP